MDFSVNVPINTVSFGQVSLCILKEMYKKGLQPNIFPIGQISSIEVEKDFGNWLQSCIKKSLYNHKRTIPTFKLWHLDRFDFLSYKQILFTFHELDSPTEVELNVAKNNDVVIFSSNYSKNIFEENGVENCKYIPLGFDFDSFYRKDINSYLNDRITFSVLGKLEKRKNHGKTIRAWIKKFGKDKRYFLSCAVHNPFYKNDVELKTAYLNILEGKNDIFNVRFYDRMPNVAKYNDFLNSANIVLAMSGGEGWGLPEFQSVAMGKHAVTLNATAYKDWADSENSVLVEPNAKVPVYDNKFFIKGYHLNQGNIFSFDEDAFIHGCEKAIERFDNNPINEAGLLLPKKFNYKNTTEQILKEIEKLS